MMCYMSPHVSNDGIRCLQYILQASSGNCYPNTPLSLNHALMKGKPIRPDNAPRSTIPDPPTFNLGSDVKVAYNSPGAWGVKNTPAWAQQPGQKHETELY